ncbi:MAG: FtsX-like permease family protein [Clostridiales bacterium]|nr:FtsX-like permease family protein [Clostridiales bacterium]
MYFKLAFRNIKRSIKDYSVYFLTLVIAVCIFYAFNSIKAQSVLLDLSDEQRNIFDAVSNVLTIFSVFISFVLGFLIIYANNYLIKRRKKELGIYLILGMEKDKVSKILFIETFLVGIISLFIGTLLGIFISQFMSVITGKLFQADLSSFKFVFSYSSFIKTIISFSIIYIIVLLFNSKVLKKVKVINLLNAAKKNENIKVKNLTLSVILFLISVGFIGFGYYLVLKDGIAEINKNLGIAIPFGAIGTFLLFMSLSGFLLKLLKSCKKVYFKELNMFLLRQINSKINTTFVSMSFICLMLFVSICTLSGGISITNGINKNLKDLTPHNMTAYSYSDVDIPKLLQDNNFDFSKYFNEYHFYQEYIDNEFKYSSFLSSDNINKLYNYYMVNTDQMIPVIKLSDYNKELSMLNKKQVDLQDNEYLVYTDIKDMFPVLDETINKKTKIKIHGNNLTPKEVSHNEVTFVNATMKNNMVTVVVNDKVVEGLGVRNSYFNAEAINTDNYDELNNNIKSILEKNKDIHSVTDKQVKASSQGIGAMIAYIGIYLGIIFIISSAAILAIQQLSETSDNICRYSLLSKIGVDESEINKSLFKQTGIYFLMPLIVAIIHSVVGIKISKDIVTAFGSDSSILNLILISTIFIVVIYGGYFMATYLNAKNTIKNKI